MSIHTQVFDDQGQSFKRNLKTYQCLIIGRISLFAGRAYQINSVGNLYPGSLNRATGEIVTESEVSRVFRGTDNRQSDLGSWGPSTAREGRPKGNITSLPSVFRPSLSCSLFFHFS